MTALRVIDKLVKGQRREEAKDRDGEGGRGKRKGEMGEKCGEGG